MSNHELLATFGRARELIAAAHAVRAAGLSVVDAYAPFPIEGLRPLLDARSSAPARACLGGALLGGIGGGVFQVWASAVSWPLNIGGKPRLAWLAYLPVTFELAVMCAGIGTVVAFVVVSGLRPVRRSSIWRAGATDDRFVLQVDAADVSGMATGRALLRDAGAIHIEERVSPMSDRPGRGPA